MFADGVKPYAVMTDTQLAEFAKAESQTEETFGFVRSTGTEPIITRGGYTDCRF